MTAGDRGWCDRRGLNRLKTKTGEERQAFLLGLSDTLRTMRDEEDASACAATYLGLRLRASRAFYAELDATRMTVARNYTDGVRSIEGEHCIAGTGGQLLHAYRAGGIIIVDDVRTDPRLDAPTRAALSDREVGAFVDVVLIDDSQAVRIFAVQSAGPREWASEEISLIRDVGERVRSAIERIRGERAVRESESRLAAIFSTAPVGLSEVSLDGRFLRVNDELCRIVGRSRDEVLRLGVSDVTYPDDLEPSLQAIAGALATGGTARLDKRYTHPDGTLIHANSSVTPLTEAGGPVERLLVVTVDLTARREGESRVRESEARLRTLTEGIPQLVWRAGKGGLWTWSSPQWQAFTGQSVEESRGLGWLNVVHEDDRDDAMRAWHSVHDTDEVDIEYRIARIEDGAFLWFRTRTSAVRDEQGRTTEWLGTSTDIDELRSLQNRQAVLVAELQHRTRNLMSVVRAVFDTTWRDHESPATAAAVYRSRLEALARVQGLLSRLHDVERVGFDEILLSELSAMGAVDQHGTGERTELVGPRGVRLRSSMVQTFSLALHELATNASKYGALAAHQPDGRLSVAWQVMDGPARSHLKVSWIESGVVMPRVDPVPKGGGFGRDLIEQALPFQLDAETSFELGRDGVRCTITLPLPSA